MWLHWLQGRNQGCSCSCSVTVKLIIPNEKPLVITILYTRLFSLYNNFVTSIFSAWSNFTTGTSSITIFFLFSQRGTSRQQNCYDEHFLITKNFSPCTRQDFHNEASCHLVFFASGSKYQKIFIFYIFQCIMSPLSLPNDAQKFSNIHRFLSNI